MARRLLSAQGVCSRSTRAAARPLRVRSLCGCAARVPTMSRDGPPARARETNDERTAHGHCAAYRGPGRQQPAATRPPAAPAQARRAGPLVPATSIGLARLFQVDDTDTRRALDLVAADPGRQFLFALLGYVGIVTIVPAFLAAARLSRRRRPVLTMVALGINLAAYLGSWAIGAIDNLYLVGGRLPADQRDTAALVIDKLWSEGLAGVSTGVFVLGHVLGAILMAFALRDSIPTIGWVAMLLTTPAHVVAFVVLQAPVLDMGAWLLMALSFAFCARAILRTPDEHWDVPPATTLTTTGNPDRCDETQETPCTRRSPNCSTRSAPTSLHRCIPRTLRALALAIGDGRCSHDGRVLG